MRRVLAISAVCAILAVAALVITSIYARVAASRLEHLEATCEQVCRWASEQALPVGAHHRSHLPPSLSLPPGSEVDVVMTAESAVIVLLKTEVREKGNYEGVLYSTRPLEGGEIDTDYSGRQEIAIPEFDGSRPVIKSRVNPRFFRVFFDLG